MAVPPLTVTDRHTTLCIQFVWKQVCFPWRTNHWFCQSFLFMFKQPFKQALKRTQSLCLKAFWDINRQAESTYYFSIDAKLSDKVKVSLNRTFFSVIVGLPVIQAKDKTAFLLPVAKVQADFPVPALIQNCHVKSSKVQRIAYLICLEIPGAV